VIDLPLGLIGVPAQRLADQLGDGRGGGHPAVPGLDRDPGAPGQHILQVQGALMAGGMHHFDPQVVGRRRQWREQVWAIRGQGEHLVHG
jgi:hypothetical protein